MIAKLVESILLFAGIGCIQDQSFEASREDLRASQAANMGLSCLENKIANPLFHSSIPYQEKASEEKMALFKALMNKEKILTFVSHPKTQEYFLQECNKFDDYIRNIYPALLSLLEQYPDNNSILWDIWAPESDFNKINYPLPYRKIVIPFLKCGVMNTSGIQNEQILARIRELQVRLFKNFLARKGIGQTDELLEADLIAFCQNNPLPIFSSVIGPFLALELDFEDEDGGIEVVKPYREILAVYGGDDNPERLSYQQTIELECAFNPSSLYCRPIQELVPFPWHLLYKELADQGFGSSQLTLPKEELQKEVTPPELALEELYKKVPLPEDGFSLQKIFNLFFSYND